MKHSTIDSQQVEDLEQEPQKDLAEPQIAALKQALKKMYSKANDRKAFIREIRKQHSELRKKNVVFSVVPVSDRYEAEIMHSVIKQLPTLVEAKVTELRNADIKRYLEAIMPPDPLKQVRLEIESDNLKLRRRFLKGYSCYDSKSVNRNAGFKTKNQSQTASRWKKRGHIFSVEYFGKELFPAFQFRDGKPLPGIQKVLNIFGDQLSSWEKALWFTSENGWLDNKRPIDLLLNKEEEVLKAAKREIEPSFF